MADIGRNQVAIREHGDSINFKCPILTPTTYTSWAIKMEAFMDAQGIRDAIEPQGDEVSYPKLGKKAQKFIFQALPEDVLMQVVVHKTAKEVWEALKKRFLGEDRVKQARIQTLDSEFEVLKMSESESIDSFAGRIGELTSKYRALGTTLADSKLVRKFLKAAPEKYLPIVAAIEQFSDLNTIPFEELLGRLKTYEERIKPMSQPTNIDL